jgi:hypothetical protein
VNGRADGCPNVTRGYERPRKAMKGYAAPLPLGAARPLQASLFGASRNGIRYLSAASIRAQIVSSTLTRAKRLSLAGTIVQGAEPVEVRSNMSLAAVA